MINISPIYKMEDSLKALLENAELRAEKFRYYGILSTSGPDFDSLDLVDCEYLTDKLAAEGVVTFSISPGTWQPGAMRYKIYLIT
jgi:hypothetical protein